MIDQGMNIDIEAVYQNIMLGGIITQKFEKSEKKQIWKDLNQNGKLSKSSSNSDQDLAKVLLAQYYTFSKQSGQSIKDQVKLFDKSIRNKIENVFTYYFEKAVKPTEKRPELNQLAQNLFYQQQINGVDNEQLKYLNQMTVNPNIMNMQLGMQSNSTQPLLSHQFNSGQMMAPYLNNYSTFSTTQPQDIYQMHQYAYPALQNQFIHSQNNQGVPQLQQTFVYGRNNTPEIIQNQGLQSSFPATNYIQNTLGNLNFQINSLPLQNQQIGYPQLFGTQAATTGPSTSTLDSSRLQNQMYFQPLNNGFPKIPGTENTYQIDQLGLQYQTNQASNQSIQQQKISQNQKQVQAPYQQPNQSQQFQMQQQSQQLQGQLPQQQIQQAQNQQRQNQNTIQKSKQQSNINPPLNTSQSISTTSVIGNSVNSKQCGAQQIPQTGSKIANQVATDLFQLSQKQQQAQGKSQKQKSKNSNNNSSNPAKSSSGSQISVMNNQINNQYGLQQLAIKNGAGAYPMKVVEIEATKNCICSQISRLRNSSQEQITCKNKNCQQKLHLSCMKISPKDEESIQQFECPSCILKKYDPLHHVEQILVDCQAMMSIPNKQLEFYLSSEIYSKLRDNSDYCLEVRCIRIDGTKNIYETTWPDFGCLKMNSEIVLEQKPLQNNSSLKKRKDEKFTFKGVKSLREGLNIMQVQEFACNIAEKSQMRITENAVHCVSVFIIRRLTSEQLASSIKKNYTRPAEECKQQILNYFTSQKNGEDDEICIDSLSVNLTCSLDMKLIQTPAKGRFCKHFQCFSLENFILTTETVNPRKWRCNICKAKCYDIVVDEYILKIIQEINEKQIKNVTDVKFDNKGLYSFDQQSYSDDDDDFDDDDSKPIKKAQSTSNQVNTPSAAAASNTTAGYQNNKGTNGLILPKGVSIDSHSNSIGTDMQSLNSGQQQQMQNKRKPQAALIEIDSDEEPPVQKRAIVPTNQPKQVTTSNALPSQFQQYNPPQQQQMIQQSGNHHHHGIISNNGLGNVINSNQGQIGVNNTNLQYTNQINSNPSVQVSNMTNQKNIQQNNTSQLEQQIQKTLQISSNSHLTSNTGNNTVNSQNITSMIPTINQEKGQSSNQTPINIQTKSKKSILTEDPKQEPTKIQNHILNINQQQSIRLQTNHREQKPTPEEIQKDLILSKKNNATSISIVQQSQETIQQNQQIIQQQPIQQQILHQQNIYNQQRVQKQQISEQQPTQRIQNQQQQIQYQQLQIQNKIIGYQSEQPIQIESSASEDFNEEISTQMQQKQTNDNQQNKQSKNQSKDNSKNLNSSSFTDSDRNSNSIGININKILNPFQKQSMQSTVDFKCFDSQKMEEISNVDSTKSNQQVLNIKDIQNIEKKRIQNEQRLDEDKSYFDEFLCKNNQVLKQSSFNELSLKSKINTNIIQSDSQRKNQMARTDDSTGLQQSSVLKNIYIQTQINNIINQFQEFRFITFSCSDDEDEHDEVEDESNVVDDDYQNLKDDKLLINKTEKYKRSNVESMNDSQEEKLQDELIRDKKFQNEYPNRIEISPKLDNQNFNTINIKKMKQIEKIHELDNDSYTSSDEQTDDADYIKKLQTLADKIRADQRLKSHENHNMEYQKDLTKIENNRILQPQENIINKYSNIQFNTDQDIYNYHHHSEASPNINMLQERQNINQEDNIFKIHKTSSSHQHLLARNFDKERNEKFSPNSNFQNNLNQFNNKSSHLFKNSSQNGAPENIPIKFQNVSQGTQKRKIIEKATSNDDGLSKKRIFEKITGSGAGKVDNPIILDD